jgi:two-component system cell cycle response regulator
MCRDEPVRILVADDDLTTRLVLTGLLRKWGHEVVAAVDGTQAWETMQGVDAPTLAILDWMMPGLSGVEVCGRVRSLPSDQPPYLIILTSKGEKADIVAGLDAGADDYLAKPFDPGELRARVNVGQRMIDLEARLLEARDALAHEATHDPLTGAFNRRAFAGYLTRAISEERRHHDGLALGICDVDEFKKINETHGHQVGDEVLVGLVGMLSGTLRGHDVLGRHGGDEFVVLAGHIADADVGPFFERMRAAVAGHPILTKSGEVSITLCFGVSRWTDDQTEDELLAAADTALYRAKGAGRNRVALAGDPAASTG